MQNVHLVSAVAFEFISVHILLLWKPYFADLQLLVGHIVSMALAMGYKIEYTFRNVLLIEPLLLSLR